MRTAGPSCTDWWLCVSIKGGCVGWVPTRPAYRFVYAYTLRAPSGMPSRRPFLRHLEGDIWWTGSFAWRGYSLGLLLSFKTNNLSTVFNCSLTGYFNEFTKPFYGNHQQLDCLGHNEHWTLTLSAVAWCAANFIGQCSKNDPITGHCKLWCYSLQSQLNMQNVISLFGFNDIRAKAVTWFK